MASIYNSLGGGCFCCRHTQPTLTEQRSHPWMGGGSRYTSLTRQATAEPTRFLRSVLQNDQGPTGTNERCEMCFRAPATNECIVGSRRPAHWITGVGGCTTASEGGEELSNAAHYVVVWIRRGSERERERARDWIKCATH